MSEDISDATVADVLQRMKEDADAFEAVALTISENRPAFAEIVKRVSPVCPSDAAAMQLGSITVRALRAFAADMREALALVDSKEYTMRVVAMPDEGETKH